MVWLDILYGIQDIKVKKEYDLGKDEVVKYAIVDYIERELKKKIYEVFKKYDPNPQMDDFDYTVFGIRIEKHIEIRIVENKMYVVGFLKLLDDYD